MTEQHQSRIDILDYARFLAAFLVMGFHYFFFGVKEYVPVIGFSKGWSDIFQFGYAGVSLFFMISGYVIFYSSKGRTAAQFASARILRLYPAFLTALIITTIFLYFFGLANEVVNPLQFLQNLTMLPTDLGGKYVDGSYWTLRLEIFFYALIFIIILVGAAAHLERFFLIWPVIILVAQFTPLNAFPLLNCYFAYFAAGALFAMRRIKFTWVSNAMIVLCYFESLYWSSIFSHPFDTGKKVMLLAITGFYLFFVLMNKKNIFQMKLPGANLLGALTYPLYLLHQMIGYIIIRMFATPENKVSVTLGTMVAMVIAAYLLHITVEVKGKLFSKKIITYFISVPINYVENLIRFSGRVLK